MDAFLAAALAPKAKRKATPLSNNRGESSKTGNTSARDGAKRHRPEGENLKEEVKTEASRTKTSLATVPAAASQSSTPQDTPPDAPLPSFLATVTGLGVPRGSSRTRELIDKAADAEGKGQLKTTHALLTRALVLCTCHAQLRNQFREVGASLDAINPVGQCSCRDFVAAAQTRRAQKMTTALIAAPESTAGDGALFPITELDLGAVYALATGSVCTCGSGRIRCVEQDHLKALDKLANITDKLGRADDAISLAQWYVDLAPHHAQGYLLLAKAVMGKAKTKPMDTRLQEVIELEVEKAKFVARCLYTHGVHNVTKHGNAEDDLLRVLRGCVRRYSHGDYLPELPVETVEAIFEHLRLDDVLACRRVSERWAHVLRRVRLRMPAIRFAGKKEHPTRGLQSLIRQFPGLQTDSLVISFPNSKDAVKGAQFVTAALRHFSTLRSLDLYLWNCWAPDSKTIVNVVTENEKTTVRAALGPPPLPALPAVCKCLSLVLRNTWGYSLTLARCVLAWASQSVEQLSIDGNLRSDNLSDNFVLRMPRLRIVTIVGRIVWSSSRAIESAFARQIIAATTSIEQLKLDYIDFELAPSRDDPFVDELEASCRQLHTLVIGENCLVHNMDRMPSPGNFLALPRLPAGMRCIDIMSRKEELAQALLLGAHYDWWTDALVPEEAQSFEHLELFRCLAPITHPDRLFQVIAPSLNALDGRLAHLELNAMHLPKQFLTNTMPSMRIPYPERLRTVGLYQFSWTSMAGMGGGSSASVLRDREFLDWVALFRNVETVAMYPAWCPGGSDEGSQLVMALVEQMIRKAEADARADQGNTDPENVAKHLKLRTVHCMTLPPGAMLDLARQLIGNYPITIQHKVIRPSSFPWPLGSENLLDAL